MATFNRGKGTMPELYASLVSSPDPSAGGGIGSGENRQVLEAVARMLAVPIRLISITSGLTDASLLE